MSNHYLRYYEMITQRAEEFSLTTKNPEEKIDTQAYQKMCQAIRDKEIGCYFYLCQK